MPGYFMLINRQNKARRDRRIAILAKFIPREEFIDVLRSLVQKMDKEKKAIPEKPPWAFGPQQSMKI
jgi:hypothetical protein